MKYLIILGSLALIAFGFMSVRNVTTAEESDIQNVVAAFDGEPFTDLERYVTMKDGTERPFQNKYWDNKAEGIYVCVISGKPLFSSQDKYKSGTGWPSFTRPIDDDAVIEDTDYKLGYARTEVRSASGQSHLGHVFKDGPEPTGLRYCMNSAAMRFIPADELAEKGYATYADAFKTK